MLEQFAQNKGFLALNIELQPKTQEAANHAENPDGGPARRQNFAVQYTSLFFCIHKGEDRLASIDKPRRAAIGKLVQDAESSKVNNFTNSTKTKTNKKK